MPGPNADPMTGANKPIVKTYYYTFDPNYTADPSFPVTQAEMIGKPLAVVVRDSAGVVVTHEHYRYNSAFMVGAEIDSVGGRIDYTFNAAKQPLSVTVAPGQSGGRAHIY